MLLGQVYCIFAAFVVAVKGSEFAQQPFDNPLAFNEIQKVNITVYYETLCSDSKAFILSMLYPNYPKLKDYISLRLVPFGKANLTSTGEYYCQHGPEECLRNMYSVCALYNIPDEEEKLTFVACAFEFDSLEDYRECARQSGVYWHQVEKCTSSDIGLQLISSAERDTRDGTDGPSFVPTITVNGVFNKQDQKDSLRDITKVVCRYVQVPTPFCSNEQFLSSISAGAFGATTK